ncbi:hypothetical protein EYR40_000797 [Pleurotus pulmonarius]|nr:hypothetical protein EYR38_004042 [Pleurotus pulmonarius]KAF4608452.1 hypothetical protein EYR40_000797 [Pleurotus pulmonarius]
MSMQPMPTNADIWGSPQRSKGGDDFTLMASREITTKGGDELCLTYGAHCNTTLFVEYGFVNVFTSDMIAGGSFRGEVNVQNVMAASFDSGERDRAAWLKSTLEDEGYWGYVPLQWPQTLPADVDVEIGRCMLHLLLHTPPFG